ncbi:MAG TPA: gliding motility-associated C-terminal domain-containing protein, partial [Chitinophagales bacterium]|nr:gliding motility-associated C-terminal domain-containing protein [Chitinophagales bacterium]
TGVIISLCGAGTTFNTVLYLLDASCNQISSNDNSCGNVSQITANLCTPGTYKVVVDGATASSQGTFSLTITDDASALISVAVTGTNVLCNGGNDGTATATVSNGSAPFTFVWNPNVGNTQTITGLTAGVYSVTVTDATGCQATGAVAINEPSALSFTTSVTPPACNGGNDASITVTATGGTPAYQYSSDGGNIFQNSNVLAGLDAGTYVVMVKDANGCSVTNSVIITDPAAIQPNLTVTNISCNGANDGSVVSNPTNGTPPYEFSLDNGPFISTNTFTGLSTGFHLLNVRDANGCEQAAGFNIFEPATLNSLVTVINHVKCNGGNDGSFTITGVGGTLPYSYSLDNVVYQPSGTFSNLTAGIYNVFVKDSNGCQTLNSVTITEPAPLVPAVLFQINISCSGSTDGAVVLTASGGTGPYQFSDDHIFYQQSGYFDRLAGGTYTFYVKDNNNCEDSITFTIYEPTPLTLAASAITDATCLGVNDGSITLDAGGGTPPYKFSINGGAFQNDSTFSGLTAGSYDFTVRDDNFCELTQSFTIGFVTTITVNLSVSNITCHGDSSGSIRVFPSNGQAPYTFSLDGITFQSSGTFSNLAAGDYTVTVKDFNGCLAIEPVTITQPGPLIVTLVATSPAKCFNTTDGSVDIDVTGGDAPYTYLWSNGFTTQNLLNVAGGTYTVTVTDASNCTAALTATVGQSPPLFIDIESMQHVSCNGAGDGYINVTVNGGTPGYIYLWSNGNNTEDLVNLGPGSYSLTVADANNCSLSEIYTITSPAGLFLAIEAVTGAVCANGNNGSITVSATGGTAPLTYSIDGFNFQSATEFTGLTAGTYTVVVKDDNGCTDAATAAISEGNDIFFSYGNDIEIINGQSVQLEPIIIPDDIRIDSVLWEPSAALSCSNCINPVANPAQTTVYTVTLIDSSGCVANTVIRVVVRDDWQIFVPNIFTPNGDEVNDRFSFHAYGTSRITVRIFNRWGAQVYYNPNQQPNTEAEGWDGMYNGKEAQQGAYTYMLDVLFTNNEQRTKTGTITLIR